MACYTPIDNLPLTGETPFTDFSRWKLTYTADGGHIWKYLTDEELVETPQTTVERFWLGLPMGTKALPAPDDGLSAARNGLNFLKKLQADDGHWAGAYSGPMFLLPGVVIGSYVTGMPFKEEERLEIIRYLFNRAHPVEGGWGLHIEGPSTVLGITINYMSLRILGVPAEHPIMVKARGALHKLGGATHAPQWAVFWMCVMNVYDWEGCNPIPPEFWAMPDWVPFHPWRWWIHCRQVYVPMSYLYGIRWATPENDLVLALRQELYVEDFYQIDWPSQRNKVAAPDLYVPHSPLLNFANVLLGAYENCAIPPMRRMALDVVYKQIVYEDDNTGYQDLAPVNMMMNAVVRYVVEGPESEAHKRRMAVRADSMWVCEEGLFVGGTNGSQLWDIVFITQAMVESELGMEEENRESLLKALQWLDMCQIKQDPPFMKEGYRHPSKGAWPFSTRSQGYTVSDCTGEAVKSVIYIQEHVPGMPKLVSERRLCDAIDILIGMQNDDGGFSSYEKIRGPWWVEWLNPAEIFGDIMIEHSYPECTTSVVTALAIFTKYYPHYRASDIKRVTHRAVEYLHKVQTPEGVWYGSWGICHTYATQFALESLSLVGETYATSERVRRACDFLVSKQMEDGGWGESWESCEQKKWINHKKSQVVQTSWAVMSLMYGKYPHPEPIERGMRLVMSRQRPDGSWAQEALEGMFNKTVTIAYPNFKMSFTIWMLGKAHHYLAELRGEKSNGHANGHAEKNGHAKNGYANGNGHTNGYANGNGH